MNIYKFPENDELTPVPNEHAFVAFASDISHLGFRGQTCTMFNGFINLKREILSCQSRCLILNKKTP
jgi:hypothetical protein